MPEERLDDWVQAELDRGTDPEDVISASGAIASISG